MKYTWMKREEKIVTALSPRIRNWYRRHLIFYCLDCVFALRVQIFGKPHQFETDVGSLFKAVKADTCWNYLWRKRSNTEICHHCFSWESDKKSAPSCPPDRQSWTRRPPRTGRRESWRSRGPSTRTDSVQKACGGIWQSFDSSTKFQYNKCAQKLTKKVVKGNFEVEQVAEWKIS